MMENLQLINNDNFKNTNSIEEKYWNIIYNMKWYFNSRNYKEKANDKIAEYLTNNLTLSEIENFMNFVVDKRKYLQDRIKSYLRILNREQRKNFILGDDGTWDLCSHIVGMGETMYYYTLHHIDIIFLLQKDIQENFEYGFDKAIYEINNNKNEC